jgi:hypothetical protein
MENALSERSESKGSSTARELVLTSVLRRGMLHAD